jgi:hypothetical protein
MSAISAFSASIEGGGGKLPDHARRLGHRRCRIGEKAGPGFAYDEIGPAVERLVTAYLDLRETPQETFLQAFRRLGAAPFKQALYGREGSARCRVTAIPCRLAPGSRR